MGKGGSTRGHNDSHRGRQHRKSSNSQAFPDIASSVFQSQYTPTVSSGRRRRTFQPDEVNKKVEKSEFEATQGRRLAENLTIVENHETHNTDHEPVLAQVVTLDASRPELDLVQFNGVSEPIESETSSLQIITERKPSCWSIASPPKAVPTEWNSAVANIDRPAPTKLPIYRIPKPEHREKRDLTSSSFNRQQAKLKQQAVEVTPKAQTSFEIESPHMATSARNDAQASAHVASLKDSHAADLSHRNSQQLHSKAQLNAEQVSHVTPEDALASNVQVSLDAQLESDTVNISSPIQGAPKAKLSDVKETSVALSALPSQFKMSRDSTPQGKQNGVVPPHLRVQTARLGQDRKTDPLLPHPGNPAGHPTTTITKAHGDDTEVKKHMSSAMQVNKLPPHLQVSSPIKTWATESPLSVATPIPTSKQNDASYRPTIDIDEEIAATQPILDIDEEIVAGLRAEETDALTLNQPAISDIQENNEQVVYVPPHTKAQFLRSKASAAESKSVIKDQATRSQVEQHKFHNQGTNATSQAGTREDFTCKREIAKFGATSKNGTIPSGAESSVRKGKKAARVFGSVEITSDLVGWDGKMNPPPVGEDWDRRIPFDPRSHERLSVIKAWREEQAADPEEGSRVVVDTASADFQTGEGLAGGDVNVLSPIDKREHEIRASNDDFTQARRHQNAAEAIKDYKAKIAAKPKASPSGIEGMTKEEKRSLRRALIEEERTRGTLPNPHAPAANIYIRPAEFKDMGQVTKIDNHYVRTTSFVLDLDPVDELCWRSRLQEAENERNPFIVAIHMGEKSCRNQEDIIRKKQENIVGFAVAADFGNKTTMYHSSVELELMVHPQFLHQGIGRTLLDRILGALSPDHTVLECAPFLPHNDFSYWIGGGSRQAKAIIVNIHYPEGEEDTIRWRKQWLAKYDFKHAGTLPQVGFRKGKLVNTCQFVLNTSARL